MRLIGGKKTERRSQFQALARIQIESANLFVRYLQRRSAFQRAISATLACADQIYPAGQLQPSLKKRADEPDLFSPSFVKHAGIALTAETLRLSAR